MGIVNNHSNHSIGPLDSTTLIRGVYRSLMNTGRTYAGFETRHMSWVDSLRDRKEVLDPMAGYGGLMQHCCQRTPPLSTFGIECNPPSYLWQVLTNPGHSQIINGLCGNILANHLKWPRQRLDVVISDSWFPEESLNMLESLWHTVYNTTKVLVGVQAEEIALSLLLPFVGRLSSTIQGSNAIHVKQGGLCVYKGWRDDFKRYLNRLKQTVISPSCSCGGTHVIQLGDARNIQLGGKRFDAMFTSPPYPNRGDYSKIFAPENHFLQWLNNRDLISSDFILSARLIGGVDVSESGRDLHRAPVSIKSKSANDFLKFIEDYRGTAKAQSDNKVYYLPYYQNYFHGLELAYENIATYLSSSFLGYIVVVNNTARKRVIPVDKFICETWKRLGFQTEIVDVREMAHLGGINPRVKGLSARHAEYTIKVQR